MQADSNKHTHSNVRSRKHTMPVLMALHVRPEGETSCECVCVCGEHDASSLQCSLETSLSHKAYYYDYGTENNSFSKTSFLESALIFASFD